MLARCTLVDVLRAPARRVAVRPLAGTASAPKTASGGLALPPRRRVGRTAPQPTVAPGKNRPRYDFPRWGVVLPQSVARTRICRAGKLLAELADFATDLGLGVGGAGAAVGGATGGLPGAMAGATPGLAVAGGGGATSAVGNLAMDLAGRNYTQGAVRFALNFGGGKIISRLSDAGRIGSFLNPSTRKFIADAYGEVAGAATGKAFSPDSPVNCEAIQ